MWIRGFQKLVFLSFCSVALSCSLAEAAPVQGDASGCQNLKGVRNLTILSARLVAAAGSIPDYCYVRGLIAPAIHYHLQLPLPANWNGRFLNWGDGAKDGDLDFADHRVAEGYAVANSNTGHDAGSEPGAWFAHNNPQAQIDFGYRAVNLTIKAARTLVRAYYGRPPEYSYHEGCSTGGRQGLMEAQRFPYDFDGIVAGAPVNFYQETNMTHVWMLQRVFANKFAGNLAYDGDGDGQAEGLEKLEILRKRVLEKCDSNDGIRDQVVDDPLACDFVPNRDLIDLMCEGGSDGGGCFTSAQVRLIEDFYQGAYDSRGVPVFKGLSLGAEYGWARYIASAENSMSPLALVNASNHGAFLFYEKDPGVPVPDPADLSYQPDRTSLLPEWAWWEFNIDDITAGKADFMKAITNAADPDLKRFLLEKRGKLILYHGWGDVAAHPEPTLDYYKDVVKTTFGGDVEKAREDARIFMVPGMSHCGGGPGPNDWDKLAPLVNWVENGVAPEFVVAVHREGDRVENERKVCAYPEQASYSGPERGADDPANWLATNFECRAAAN